LEQPVKILFLYTELAGYFLACVNELASQGAEVHIVRWPVNEEAPFRFEFGNVRIYERRDLDRAKLLKLAEEIDPSVIYCSGWMDKDYMEVSRRYRNRIPVIVGFDNQWKGTLKQRIACLFSRFLIHRYYTHCWVPGALQREYALRLGFPVNKILMGYYSCDFDYFHKLYLANRAEKEKSFPGKLLYVGRYYTFKGIEDLWHAFAEIQQELPNDWELWCLGTGDLKAYSHPKIKHFGFVQPSEMSRFVSEAGVFVLPSHFEPWGVVVHEFAASGFPLIVSDEVGARTAFVEHGHNGYIYTAGDREQLKSVLKKIMNLPGSELFAMGERSVEKAKQITPAKWARTILSVISG
jgi:glycosyltransferase involved in cell wall biosynthesis